MAEHSSLSYFSILQKAWPIILANAAVPLLALSDTAIIGNLGTINDLGAIAFGSLIFSFVYWSFGFLRMSTTGFTAQAAGANDTAEVRNTLWRGLAIGFCIGIAIILLQWPLKTAALSLLHGEETVEQITAGYFSVRVWGAPATLCTFALMGTLIGLGKSRLLLLIQVFLNGLNIGLDILFVAVFDLGAQGIALGTCIAEWATVVLSLVLVIRLLKQTQSDTNAFFSKQLVFARREITKLMVANSDILIRTVLMLFCFYWFTDQSAIFGKEVLAANHILLQIISFSAFFLDGFAFVAESLTGAAIGGKRKDDFFQAIKRTSVLAGVTAALLALIVLLLGNTVIAGLTDIAIVRTVSSQFLPFCAAYVFLSVAAFQLDGIFIGATRTTEMRNASFQSATLFLLVSIVLMGTLQAEGLWLAFIAYVAIRGVTLLCYLPRIVRAF